MLSTTIAVANDSDRHRRQRHNWYLPLPGSPATTVQVAILFVEYSGCLNSTRIVNAIEATQQIEEENQDENLNQQSPLRKSEDAVILPVEYSNWVAIASDSDTDTSILSRKLCWIIVFSVLAFSSCGDENEYIDRLRLNLRKIRFWMLPDRSLKKIGLVGQIR